MCREGDPLPDAAKHARPGTTTAFYMSVRQADRISAGLISKGLAPDSEVSIAANASKSDARHLSCPLDQLAQTLAKAGITGCATLIVTWPKQANAPTRQNKDLQAAL
jgi:uroporphyrin-III C-methyltransferase/precorrin-2 dehydrogenase/sirohydrochlorin ferrochelatase